MNKRTVSVKALSPTISSTILALGDNWSKRTLGGVAANDHLRPSVVMNGHAEPG